MVNGEKHSEGSCLPDGSGSAVGAGAGSGAAHGGGYRRVLRVWVVDDYAELRGLFSQYLDAQPGFKCNRQFASVESLLSALAEERAPDLILLDVNLSGISGLKGVPLVLKLAPPVKVVMMTTFSNVSYECEAFAAGAAGFVLKSYDLDHIVSVLQEAYRRPTVSKDLFPNLNTRTGEKTLKAFSEAAAVESKKGGIVNAFRQLWGESVRRKLKAEG